MKTKRWSLALHEAGHAVSALTMGGRCYGVALLDDDNGNCQSGELLGDREAYCTAAGPAAEKLADEYPVPKVTVSGVVVNADNFEKQPVYESAPILARQMARTAETRTAYKSDERVLAEWAIAGLESSPELWAGRVAFAHEMAGHIVQHNAAAIVKLATSLFASGSLSESQIDELLKEAQ